MRAHLRAFGISLAAIVLVLLSAGSAQAMERIKSAVIPPDSPPPPGGGSPMAAGSLVRAATATTTWYLYPGACTDRAIGTWAPRATPQADSLDSYAPGGTGPYGVEDQSLHEILWHVSDNAVCTPGTTCPAALGGTRMLWCGKYDAAWVVHFGYPSFTYQILYIDTGSHGGSYNLTFDYNFSTESIYDNAYLVGGGGGLVDPIGNSRAQLDDMIAAGSYLAHWTGSVALATANASGGSTTGGPIEISGSSGAPATITGASFTIDASNRALYFVLVTDCF